MLDRMKHKLEYNLRYADDTTLMAESEELKSLLMKVKEESEKIDLKLNIQKNMIMASGPITSRQVDGETVATVADFIFLGIDRWVLYHQHHLGILNSRWRTLQWMDGADTTYTYSANLTLQKQSRSEVMCLQRGCLGKWHHHQ